MYRCFQCSRKTPSYFEQCPGCGAWGTCIAVRSPKPITLADVADQRDEIERVMLRGDWDQALGGGGMPGSVVLVYGPGGVGKSTDLLRLCAQHRGAFAASERTLQEIEIDVRAMTDVDARRIYPAEVRTVRDVCRHFELIGAKLGILDSWNSLSGPEPHEIAAIRESIGDGIALVICHQTKEGGLRGPETLAHAVNTVIRMQRRHLRVEKNWHGPLVRVARELPRFKGQTRAPSAPPRARSRSSAARAAASKTDRLARLKRRR
jgi:DNA repair protein RadA/Sms